MAASVKGKVAFITGASKGIGRATAERFAAEGARVIMVARGNDELQRVAEGIRTAGGDVTAFALDVGDLDAYARALRNVVESHGRLDVLVNNAPAGAIVPLQQTTLELWRETFRVNAEAVFVSTQIAFELMSRTGGGAIINIASIAGQRAQAGFTCYGAAKAALMQFSQTAAIEGAPIGIRVNVVVPGVIDTPALAPILADPNLRAAVAAAIPVKRLGRAEELASAILFLASDEASYITGQCLTVDGGKATQMT